MHQPRLYGRFVEDQELSSDDVSAVTNFVKRFSNYKQLAELESYKRRTVLPSGRIAMAVDAGGTFRVHVFEPAPEPEQPIDGKAHLKVPLLFSGRVSEAVVLAGQGAVIQLTEQARRRIAGYRSKSLPPQEVRLRRFAIEYAPAFQYLKPKEQSGRWRYTQYARQLPTWYSGPMSEVVQVVGGYGVQSLASLPDTAIERATMQIPQKAQRAMAKELERAVLPGYTGFADSEGQYQYDYKHAMCNGVAFDGEGSPWLLRISASGVYAMPLPMVPASTTEAFREYVQQVNDTELQALLDRFGGMPSGETFPNSPTEIEAWRRAGVIVKVCDCADFYQHVAYYAASGWAFNSHGTEGFNTCYTTDKQGLKHGYAYSMQLALQPAIGRGVIRPKWVFQNQLEADAINAYISAIYADLKANGHRERAIKYKIKATKLADVIARAKVWNGKWPDTEYWENMEMPPIAVHSGRVARVGSGALFVPGLTAKASPPLKFPTLSGEGCETFVMFSDDYKGPPVQCDTIVFGCYVNDTLQVVKYFYDERKFEQDKTSTFEEKMIVGQWEETVRTGYTGLMGNFYTTAFDDRRESPEVETTTNIVGRDLGYGQPAYQTPTLLSCVGSVSRARYYYHETKVKSSKGFGLSVAVCIPVLARDCILYAYKENTTGEYESHGTARYAMQDPNFYELWCYDDIWHYMGQTRSGNLGMPRSKDGSPVYVDTHRYEPSEWSDYADQGEWLGLPAGGFLDVTGICGPYTSRYSSNFQAGGVTIGGEAPGFDPEFSEKSTPGKEAGRLHVSLNGPGNLLVNKQIPNGWYWDFSPTEFGDYFYRDASWITFGSSRYGSISEQNLGQSRCAWGYTGLANGHVANHFIGVINE